MGKKGRRGKEKRGARFSRFLLPVGACHQWVIAPSLAMITRPVPRLDVPYIVDTPGNNFRSACSSLLSCVNLGA